MNKSINILDLIVFSLYILNQDQELNHQKKLFIRN